ncbi:MULTISPECIES: ABC transporter ATP-binding protein [Providencia]|uniref:ABC transporter ATP-binding protein n=1 Tax=Providencia TaxID=586 RepID=UPI0013A5830A|nr:MULTISPECIES: ABC transporter ATP-binding protein [Providencia]EJD6670216.1 hypothetical protein [Providencia rettgeri]ELR5294892.1 hypothetical protein [Providencia rettgeri]MBG5900256.1 hypothetical protein [Providencia rettgeri]MBQ0366138.1 hypothetical protein [Providencia rettgeri]MBS0857802.1 hypothetical protein [Providencia rettgeri]
MKFLTITALLVGIAGACLLSFGAWQVYPAAGYITAGGLCLFWSYLVSKSMSQPKDDKE